MRSYEAPGRQSAERALRQEMAEVEAAIRLVEAGASRTVSLGGLSYGEAIIAAMRTQAASRGVTLEPAWGPDDSTCDIVVHRTDG